MKWIGASDRNYSVQRGIDAPNTTLILLGRAFELTTEECLMIARDLQRFADTSDEFWRDVPSSNTTVHGRQPAAKGDA
jgi:hypothetical protein